MLAERQTTAATTQGRRLVAFLKRELRARRMIGERYTDAEFARDCGVSEQAMRRWLNSESVERLDVTHVVALENTFGKRLFDYLKQTE